MAVWRAVWRPVWRPVWRAVWRAVWYTDSLHGAIGKSHCALCTPPCVPGQPVPAHAAAVGHEEGEAKRNGESL